MYKNIIPILILIVMIFISMASAESDLDSISFTTYYPAPYGVYNEFSTYSNTNLAIREGNVGIGTVTPQEKLEVDGKIRSQSTASSDTGTTVTTKDYVDSVAGGNGGLFGYCVDIESSGSGSGPSPYCEQAQPPAYCDPLHCACEKGNLLAFHTDDYSFDEYHKITVNYVCIKP